MQIDREKILNFIRLKGPVVPVQLSNEFKQSTIIIGAVLSELVKEGKIGISNLKVGGSPLYFLKEQRYKLQEYKKYLNEKDRRAYDLLREKKVLRDIALNPLTRVCLRQIKDFAKELVVNINGKKEIFWKWYLLSDDDAKRIIEGMINAGKKAKTEEKKKEEAKDKEKRSAKKEVHDKGKKEVQKKIIEEKEAKQESRKTKPKNNEKTKPEFYRQITSYFEKKRIIVLKEETTRKNSEIDFIVKLPSSVGTIKCFLRAKKKKKINEGDLASAYVRAQYLALPLIYVSTGSLTKKAKEKIGKEFKNIKFIMI